MEQRGRFAQLSDDLKSGKIDRRQFMERATALGVGFAAALFAANAASVAAAGGSRNGYALYPNQDGTPAPSPVAGGAAAPAVGTEGKTRGQEGELKLIQWQAPTLASPQIATGDKDFLAGQLVLEPLMHYLPSGTIIPNLVTDVPSVENGLLAKDLSTVTFKLIQNVTWSDGEPFTSTDVKFTWQWVTNTTRTSNLSVNSSVWAVVKDIATPDPLTAVVTYAKPSAAWFDPF
ncbi:MAG TPA: ABC transporter substrate-binding protein, partial [Thermomicrobiales bacterium]|nr:ABC transporter substrate-binding protein [Thermomicrobiales bacterium]